MVWIDGVELLCGFMNVIAPGVEPVRDFGRSSGEPQNARGPT